MAKFRIEGEIIEAKSAEELIHLMHQRSRTPAADDKAYMMDVSDRTILQCGSKIRIDSPQAFVNDLIKHELVELVPNSGM